MRTQAVDQAGRGGLVLAGCVPRPVLVAVPAKNEAAELAGCLSALAQQDGAVDGVVICLNDCTDDSAAVIRDVAGVLPYRLHVIDISLPPDLACAGLARRIAMDRAAALAGDDGIILTTDADGRVPPDWVSGNVAAIARGADAVAGRAEIEPLGARLIPRHLHATDARECAYAALLDEIRSVLDGDPADPWPRHAEHCGASIGVTVAAYRRAGGMPAVPLAEDRAFFDRLRAVDARIRHAPQVRVVVSARLQGRAPGGMADTMRRRMVQMDAFLDADLEPARDAARRAWLRGKLRRMWQAGTGPWGELRRIATHLQIPAAELASRFALRVDTPCIGAGGQAPACSVPDQIAAGSSPGPGPVLQTHQQDEPQYFGAAWAWVERHRLPRRRVPLHDLPAETLRAARILGWLRRAADPAGTRLPVAAE